MLVDIDHNIISFSGGKDSTAMLLLAIERETDNLSAEVRKWALGHREGAAGRAGRPRKETA